MASQTDYFNRIGYQPKYWIGDRVFGRWNKIPFVGSVGNDTLINEIEGPRISIHLDLPIKFKDVVHNIIIVKHKDIKKLEVIEETTKLAKKADNKQKSVDGIIKVRYNNSIARELASKF